MLTVFLVVGVIVALGLMFSFRLKVMLCVLYTIFRLWDKHGPEYFLNKKEEVVINTIVRYLSRYYET